MDMIQFDEMEEVLERFAKLRVLQFQAERVRFIRELPMHESAVPLPPKIRDNFAQRLPRTTSRGALRFLLAENDLISVC